MSIFRPPTPTVIASAGGGGSGTSLNTSDASVILNTNPTTGASNMVFSTNNSSAMTIDETQNVKIGSTSTNPSDRLVVVAPSSGSALAIVHGPSAAQSQLNISSIGTLKVTTSGNTIDLTNNAVHLSSNSLTLNGASVTASAPQLNYLTVTPGTSSPSKALVLDANSRVTGIDSITATNLSGTLQTSHQPNIGRVTSLSIDNSISIGGIGVTSTATELNYLHIQPGTSAALKALVLDSSSSITGLYSLSASSLTGTLQTAEQPNITSVGTLTSANVSGRVGVGTSSPSADLELSNPSNPTLKLSNGSNSTTMTIDSNGNLLITPTSSVVLATNKSIQMGGTGQISGANRVSATYITGTLETSAQPNVTSVGTLSSLLITGSVGVGASSPNKKIEILDSSGDCLRISRTNILYADLLINSSGDLQLLPIRDVVLGTNTSLRFTSGSITGLSGLTANTLTGVLQTAAQTNITSIGTLESLAVTNGISAGSLSATTLTGVLQTASQTNITSIGTLGALAVTNGISAGSLSATTLTGTLQTADQTNITSIGTLGALAVTNGITAGSLSATTLTGTLQTAAQPNITSIGTLSSLTIMNALAVTTVNASDLYGAIRTTSQPNITSIGTLGSLNVTTSVSAGSVSASTLSGTIQTSSQPNITSIGTLNSLNVTNSVSAGSISATSLVGTLSTAAQPNITSVGILSRVYTSGRIGINLTSPTFDIDINSTDGQLLQGSYLGNSVSISVSTEGDCVLYTDHNNLILANGTGLEFSGGSISGLSAFSSSSITGTLATAAQPNITSLGKISQLSAGSSRIGSTHTSSYDLSILSTSGNILSLSDGDNTATHRIVDGDYIIYSNTGSVVLASGVDLALSGGTIIGLSNLSASTLTGTIQTASQPNITSVGVLDSISSTGSLTLGSTSFSEGVLSVLSNVTAGTASAGKAIVVDSSRNISSIHNLSADTLTGVIETAAQPNITSIGALSSITIGSTTVSQSDIDPVVDVTPGNAAAGKVLILNSSSAVAGISSLATTELSIGGTSLGATQADYLTSITPGVASVGKALVVDGSRDISGINSISTAELIVNGVSITSSGGSSEYVTGVTPGAATASKALIVDSNTAITGVGSIGATRLTLGNSSNTTMPLEVGFTSFVMTGAYAYNTNTNAHGTISAGGTTSYNYSIRALGRILCTQSVDVTSDRRLKNNVQALDDAYCSKFVRDTTPVSFNWNNGDSLPSYGYIAQDLLRHGFDDLVNLADDENMTQEVDDDGLISPQGIKFTISYQYVIPILAQNQKRLLRENHDLTDRVDRLTDLVNQLMRQIPQ